MRLNQNIKFKEAERIVLRNGYVYDKCRGSHYQYIKDGQRIVLTIKLNPCVWYNICKTYKLEL